MATEASSLKLLDHPLIAKYVDSNADICDRDSDLYLVTEYIQGPTLEEYIKAEGPFDVRTAAVFSLGLLNSLEHSHSRGVLHRDGKPDNIILRNGNPAEPVLLDFGISYNDTKPVDGFETESGQHLGNRFLRLPEHTQRGLKRDHRSDITQVVGLLFYAIAGLYPDTPLDDTGLKPHQRQGPKSKLNPIRSPDRDALFRIFDVGFTLPILQRWQSIELLRSAIIPLTGANDPPPVNLRERLEARKAEILSTPAILVTRTLQELHASANRFVQKQIGVANEVLKDVGRVDPGSMMADTLPKGALLLTLIEFYNKYAPNLRVLFYFYLLPVDGVVSLYMVRGTTTTELLKIGIFDTAASNMITAAIEQNFDAGFGGVL